MQISIVDPPFLCVTDQSTLYCHAIDHTGIRDMQFSCYRDIACNILELVDAESRLDKSGK